MAITLQSSPTGLGFTQNIMPWVLRSDSTNPLTKIAIQVRIETSPGSGTYSFVGEYAQQIDENGDATFYLERKLNAYLAANDPSFFDQAVTPANDICRRYQVRWGEKLTTSEALAQTFFQESGSASYINLSIDITTGDKLRLVAESTDITTLDAQVKVDSDSPVDLDAWVVEHDRSSYYWTAAADYTSENLQVPSGISIRLYTSAIEWSAYTTIGDYAVLLGGLSFERFGLPVGPPDTAISDLVVTSGLSAITSTFTADAGFDNEVWRSTNTTTGFTLLKTLAAGVTDINDTTATPGTTYYYKVRPISGSVTGLFSNVDSGQIFNAFQITVKTDNPGVTGTNQYRVAVQNHPFIDIDCDVYYNGSVLASISNADKSTGYVDLTFPDGAGTKQIGLVGTIRGFNNGSYDTQKLISINRIGPLRLVSNNVSPQFDDSINLVSVADGLVIDVTGLDRLFKDCSSLALTQSFVDSIVYSIANISWGRGLEDVTVTGLQLGSMLNANVVGAFRINDATFNTVVNPTDSSNITDFQSMFKDASAFDQNCGHFDISSMTNGNNMFNSSGMSKANYTDTIVAWANQIYDRGGTPATVNFTNQTGMTFDSSRSGGANFANAGAARTYLTSTLSWTITGDTVI